MEEENNMKNRQALRTTLYALIGQEIHDADCGSLTCVHLRIDDRELLYTKHVNTDGVVTDRTTGEVIMILPMEDAPQYIDTEWLNKECETQYIGYGEPEDAYEDD